VDTEEETQIDDDHEGGIPFQNRTPHEAYYSNGRRICRDFRRVPSLCRFAAFEKIGDDARPGITSFHSAFAILNVRNYLARAA
jgi:hypothetical protein